MTALTIVNLQSPSVVFNGELAVISVVTSDTDVPRLEQDPGSNTTSQVYFY